MIRVAHNAHEEGTHAINRANFVIRLAVDGHFLPGSDRGRSVKGLCPKVYWCAVFQVAHFNVIVGCLVTVRPACIIPMANKIELLCIYSRAKVKPANGIYHINWKGVLFIQLSPPFRAGVSVKNKLNSGSRRRR
jgi:hypothetical protein